MSIGMLQGRPTADGAMASRRYVPRATDDLQVGLWFLFVYDKESMLSGDVTLIPNDSDIANFGLHMLLNYYHGVALLKGWPIQALYLSPTPLSIQ